MRIIDIRDYVMKKRNYWSEVIILYTDHVGRYILEIRNETVFVDSECDLWFSKNKNKLVQNYLNQIKEVYGIPLENYVKSKKIVMIIVFLFILSIGICLIHNTQITQIAIDVINEW